MICSGHLLVMWEGPQNRVEEPGLEPPPGPLLSLHLLFLSGSPFYKEWDTQQRLRGWELRARNPSCLLPMTIKEECPCDFPMTTSLESFSGRYLLSDLYLFLKSQFAFTDAGNKVCASLKRILSQVLSHSPPELKGIIIKWARPQLPAHIFKYIIVFHTMAHALLTKAVSLWVTQRLPAQFLILNLHFHLWAAKCTESPTYNISLALKGFPI